MIAKLKGRIDATGADWLVIDVNGVGYHVSCSSKTLSSTTRRANSPTPCDACCSAAASRSRR